MLKFIQRAKLFLDIVEAGSFSQAAIRSNSSNAKITHFVDSLEQELKLSLFLRNTRQIKVTPEGEKYFQFCQNIIHQYEDLIETLQTDQEKISGDISFTTMVTLGSEYIAPIIGKFLKLYPDVRISLDLSDKLRDLIKQQYDFSIRMAAHLPDSTLKQKVLVKSNWILCASKSYLRKHGTPKELEQLSQHNCIEHFPTSLDKVQNKWRFIVNNKIKDIQINKVCQVASYRAQLNLAIAGAGIIRSPQFLVAETIHNKKLVHLFPNVSSEDLYLLLLYPQSATLPRRVKTLISFIQKELKFLEVQKLPN